VAAKATQLRNLKKKGNPITTSKSLPGKAADKPARQFDPTTEELLRDLRNIATRLTKYIQTSDGKRFEQYVRDIQIAGWIDYSGVKIVDKGEGLKKVNASFVALRPLYRLLVASARDRAYPVSQLKKMMDEATDGVLDGTTPPPEPEDDPANLVTPESL